MHKTANLIGLQISAAVGAKQEVLSPDGRAQLIEQWVRPGRGNVQ
jgi:hypothetical protein